MVHINLVHGLPGSGKTTYLKERRNQLEAKYGQRFVKYLDCDQLFKANDGRKTLEEILKEELYYIKRNLYSRRDLYLLIDMLSTTNDDLIKAVTVIKETFEDNFTVMVSWWEEDRESCIWNDTDRRDESAILSIKSLKFEEPDISLIKEKTGVHIKTGINSVIRKSSAMSFIHKNKLCDDSNRLESVDWCLGGTWCDCWGGSSMVSAEEAVEFEEFDKMLEEICPDISFLKYKKLRNECVEIETWEDRDYYGGSVNYSHYVCDVKKLIEMMMEMELITK